MTQHNRLGYQKHINTKCQKKKEEKKDTIKLKNETME